MNSTDVQSLRVTWEGRRVRLLSLHDPHTRLRAGAVGTVSLVDSMGTLHVRWDNGINLGLIPNVDEWTLIR